MKVILPRLQGSFTTPIRHHRVIVKTVARATRYHRAEFPMLNLNVMGIFRSLDHDAEKVARLFELYIETTPS